jgi:putative sigma-54 modulation protein
MDLQIIGKNLEVTPAMDNYLNKKVVKFMRFLPTIDEAKAELSEEKTKSPEHRFTAQITLRIKGTILRGEEKGPNINTAIDEVTESLTRQVKRYKGKLQNKKRGTSLTKQPQLVEDTGTTGKVEIFPELVKVKRFQVKLMSTAEATEQMELLNHDFFLFLNSDTGALNLVYRRKDGNYGLIEPELAK